MWIHFLQRINEIGIHFLQRININERWGDYRMHSCHGKINAAVNNKRFSQRSIALRRGPYLHCSFLHLSGFGYRYFDKIIISERNAYQQRENKAEWIAELP